MIFSKLTEFSVLRAIHPPQTLIFLRNYLCFCDASILMKFLIFTKKAKVCEKIINPAFSDSPSKEITFCEKGPKGSRIP